MQITQIRLIERKARRTYIRTNGFSHFPTIQQMLTVILLIIKLATYTLLLLPHQLASPCTIVLSTFYYLLAVTLVASALGCYLVDPVDPHLIGLGEDSEHKCLICDQKVNLESKHCIQCGRCTIGFDHHCKWVGNCIADSNYVYFAIMLCSEVTLDVVQLAQSIRVFLSPTNYTLLWGRTPDSAPLVLMAVSLGLSMLTMLAVGSLLIFHCYLKLLGLSTYDFIRRRRVQAN